jgi:hypothetical protein
MIRTPAEIAPVMKEALNHAGPVIVGVHVDYSDNYITAITISSLKWLKKTVSIKSFNILVTPAVPLRLLRPVFCSVAPQHPGPAFECDAGAIGPCFAQVWFLR